MPTYEYWCLDCKEIFSIVLSYADYGRKEVACPACGGSRVRRRIGRVRITRSAGGDLSSLADDPDALDRMEEDPRAMAQMLKGMRSEMGEETPEEVNEIVSRLDRGQSVQEIEASMPEFGDAPDADAGTADLPGSSDFGED